MTRARSELIAPDCSATYHCVSRCVRQAWLCGLDEYTGRSYEHRKDWVEARILALADWFAVSVLAYAVMSNHLHVVLRIDAEVAREWSDAEVARRWCGLFPRVEETAFERTLREQHLLANPDRLALSRARLHDLSWFMRCLSEPIARRANQEDGCKGRFWEGRFKSQLLLDDAAVVAAMTYVDLNPIRAGITEALAQTEHTSITTRIERIKREPDSRAPLRPVAGIDRVCVPFTEVQYLDLVEFSGRQWQAGKRGKIAAHAPSILSQLQRPPENWLDTVRATTTQYSRVIGSATQLAEIAERIGQRWLRGIGFARWLEARVG